MNQGDNYRIGSRAAVFFSVYHTHQSHFAELSHQLMREFPGLISVQYSGCYKLFGKVPCGLTDGAPDLQLNQTTICCVAT